MALLIDQHAYASVAALVRHRPNHAGAAAAEGVLARQSRPARLMLSRKVTDGRRRKPCYFPYLDVMRRVSGAAAHAARRHMRRRGIEVV